MADKPTITKISTKPYQCSECGHQEPHNTNHYGEIYIQCRKCSWKSPMNSIKVFRCLGTLPEGMDLPEPWKLTKLGDIAKIV